MLSYVREVFKNALEDSDFRKDMTPLWMIGSVVAGVVAAITITSAVSKHHVTVKPDLLE